MLKRLWGSAKSAEEGFAKTLMIIHGNKDHPENHNIIYTNLRGNAALVKTGNTFEYRNIKDVLDDAGANLLDLIVLDTKFDDIGRHVKEKLELICDDEELNQKAANIAKIELYNSYKKGEIRKENSLESDSVDLTHLL